VGSITVVTPLHLWRHYSCDVITFVTPLQLWRHAVLYTWPESFGETLCFQCQGRRQELRFSRGRTRGPLGCGNFPRNSVGQFTPYSIFAQGFRPTVCTLTWRYTVEEILPRHIFLLCFVVMCSADRLELLRMNNLQQVGTFSHTP
jgi:hypothetical protein